MPWDVDDYYQHITYHFTYLFISLPPTNFLLDHGCPHPEIFHIPLHHVHPLSLPPPVLPGGGVPLVRRRHPYSTEFDGLAEKGDFSNVQAADND